MKAGVAELKARLSHYLERVRAGREVLVTDRGQPIARLVPVRSPPRGAEKRDHLLRQGAIVAGRGRVRRSLLRLEEGDPRTGRSVLEALLEERREGR
jgi:prevent-host-death family protein